MCSLPAEKWRCTHISNGLLSLEKGQAPGAYVVSRLSQLFQTAFMRWEVFANISVETPDGGHLDIRGRKAIEFAWITFPKSKEPDISIPEVRLLRSSKWCLSVPQEAQLEQVVSRGVAISNGRCCN